MSANLLELVYSTPLSAYVDEVKTSGREVSLRMRDGSPGTARVLERQLARSALWNVRVDDASVVLEFADEELAAAITTSSLLIEDGPFRLGEFSEQRLVLVRREDNVLPATLEFVNMDSKDTEWRRLMAGEVDLMPGAMASALPSLSEVPELRVVPMVQPNVVGLLFRMDGGPTADRAVRAAIAASLRRAPLASVVGGDPIADPTVVENAAQSRGYFREHPIVAPMRVLVFTGATDMQRAALVVEQQLASVGLNIDIEVLSAPELVARFAARDFEMMVFLGNGEERYLHTFVGPPPGNLTGYQSVEFSRYQDAGQVEDAIRVLVADLVVTPLFRMREAVVVNRRFCNVKPVRTSEFRWLADVRPCAPGEDE